MSSPANDHANSTEVTSDPIPDFLLPSPKTNAHKTARVAQSTHLSSKDGAAALPTTLADEDWELIEDDLLPFQIVVIIVSLGGVALFALGVHMLTASHLLASFAQEFFNFFPMFGNFLTFLLTFPILVGLLQLVLAVFFSGAAAFEKWKQVSIQDVIMHLLPNFSHITGLGRIRLHCTARGAYVWTMIVFLLVQTVSAGIAVGVNDVIDTEVNKGAGANAADGLLRYVLDYSAAVFNECCHKPGWSKQGAIPRCAEGESSLAQCNITDTRLSGMQSRLCACYVAKEEEFAEYERYVNTSQLCQVASEMRVTIARGQTIPGTTFSFRTIVPSSVPTLPVVGNPSTVYGCGVGFLRGFQWSLVEWSTAELRPYFVAILAISGIQVMLLAIGMSFVCRVKRKPVLDEDGNYTYGTSTPMGLENLTSLTLYSLKFLPVSLAAEDKKGEGGAAEVAAGKKKKGDGQVTALMPTPDVDVPARPVVQQQQPQQQPKPQQPQQQPQQAPLRPPRRVQKTIDDVI